MRGSISLSVLVVAWNFAVMACGGTTPPPMVPDPPEPIIAGMGDAGGGESGVVATDGKSP